MVIVGRSQLQASISDMLYKGRKCPEWHISPRAPHSMKFWHISPGAPKSEKCWHILPTAQPSVKCVQESDWCYHLPKYCLILSENKLAQFVNQMILTKSHILDISDVRGMAHFGQIFLPGIVFFFF